MQDGTKVGDVFLPVFKNPEEMETFRKNVVNISLKMLSAVDEYLKNASNEQVPNAFSIGAACYLTSHLIGSQYTDERKAQVIEGLELMLALNKTDSSANALANLPPQDTPLN